MVAGHQDLRAQRTAMGLEQRQQRAGRSRAAGETRMPLPFVELADSAKAGVGDGWNLAGDPLVFTNVSSAS